MKKRKFVVSKPEIDRFLPVVSLLGYETLSKEEKNGSIVFTMKRENDSDFKVNYVEHKYIPTIVPFWTLLIPIILIFIVMTAYLVITLTHVWNIDKVIQFITFFVPSSLLLMVDFGLFFLRSKQFNQIARIQKDLYNIISKELEVNNEQA